MSKLNLSTTEEQQDLLIRLFGLAVSSLAQCWDALRLIEILTDVEMETEDIAELAAMTTNPAASTNGFITLERVEAILVEKKK